MAGRLAAKLEQYYRENSDDPGPARVTIPTPKGWFPRVEFLDTPAGQTEKARVSEKPDHVADHIEPDLATKFHQFFGCSAARASEGRIILQTHAIEPILTQQRTLEKLERERHEQKDASVGPVVEGRYSPLRVPEEVRIPPPSRLFKARFWINRWDAEGAFAICEGLREQGLGSPKVDLRQHGHLMNASPFEIAMGLGYTDRTNDAILGCADWMHNDAWWDCGDALSLHRSLIPKDAETHFEIDPPAKKSKGFRRLLPLGWGLNTAGHEPGTRYMHDWEQERHDVQDYAIIFRRAESGRVHFVLAGFTEKGTAAAGHYLANHWSKGLWKYVKPRSRASAAVLDSSHDFLVVIRGHSNNPEDWEEVKSFAVTPAKLRLKGWVQKQNGHWVLPKKRLPKPRSQRGPAT